MKNPERVAELLAELRALSETDFERRRIDVLERDLHEPPQVEIVDDKHQRFNGVMYGETKSRNHYSGTTQLHRVVYEYCKGEIPAENVIHHIDENPANNAIENLQCLSRTEHSKLHGGRSLKDKPLPDVERICKRCGKAFIGKHTSEYCSKECRYATWHERRYTESVCEVCGKTYMRFDYNHGNVCSYTCGGRKSHLKS